MVNNGQPTWIRLALHRYEGDLTRYAHRITGDVDRARDVVQETFLKLCQLDRSAVDGHLAEWLYTVCRNHALDVRRKERRMTTLAEQSASQTVSRDLPPTEAAERRDEAAKLMELLDRLPKKQQEVIRLKFQSALSYREISRITKLSVSNVGFLIHRGLKTLREQIEADE
jgi:RNA polymerase sigma-70 factor (ECF subfamily)